MPITPILFFVGLNISYLLHDRVKRKLGLVTSFQGMGGGFEVAFEIGIHRDRIVQNFVDYQFIYFFFENIIIDCLFRYI